MVPLSAWARAGSPDGRGSCKVSVSVYPESSSERPAQPSGMDLMDRRKGRAPLLRQSGPACSQPWRALLLTPTFEHSCHMSLYGAALGVLRAKVEGSCFCPYCFVLWES